MRILILLFISFIFSNVVHAQEISIADGDITGCMGFLVDTGLSAGDYSPNEDITITVCPQYPDTIINLNFFIFDLGDGDSMSIYDGSSTAAPLIGTYTDSSIQGDDITSNNGCLTIHWTSDGTDEGNFSIGLTCGVPCIAPVVAIDTDQGSPTRGCPDEEITFDGSNTEFFNGGTVGEFTWDFGDGTTDTASWPTVTHTYSEPGGYNVELYMTDNNGCSSTNFVSFVVLIATTPEINIDIESPICLGAEASYDIDANYEPVTWTQVSGGISGGYLYIPDDQTQSFNNSIELTGFNPTETIDEISDFDSFFINMEHSFMGDLIIQFECPNGQSLVVHQQGGGGTYLGNPIDGDATENNPGTGLDYWWSPDATNGTWEQESTNYTTLPSGVYQSTSPWSNLLGCPLNGVWTLTIVDNWGIDNGFVFDWSVSFDPSLYPDLINFTPNIGDGPDSTFWNIDPTITDISDDGNGVTLNFQEPGIYDYTYTLIDDFGCTYNEDYQIEVIQGPTPDAGEDITLCNEDGSLNGQIIAGNAPYNSAIYEWTPYDNLSDATMNLTPDVIGLDTTTTYILSVYPVNNPQCVFHDSVVVNVIDMPNPGEDTELIYCPVDEDFLLFDEIQGSPDTGGIWLDQNNTSMDSIFNPLNDQDAVYYYSFPECDVQSEISVIVNRLDIALSPDTIICQNGEATLEVETLNSFIGNANYIWNPTLPDNNSNTVSPTEPTNYSVFINYGDGCATETKNTTVTYYSPLTASITPSTTICSENDILLETLLSQGGIAPYNYLWTNSNDTILSTQSSFTADPENDETYCLTLSDQCESTPITVCSDISIEKLVTPAFEIENNAGCYPINSLFTPTETNYENILEEVWNFGDNLQGTNSEGSILHQYSNPGDYSVSHTLITTTGCFYIETQPNSIHIYPRPLASMSVENEIQVLPYTTFNYSNNSVGNVMNEWNFYSSNNQLLGTSSEENPSFTYPPMQLDKYLATLAVENEYGCTDTTSRMVEVMEDFLLFAPNAITANNDGINDQFYVQGIDIDPDNFNLQIFNRWGMLVFQTDDVNEGWNGKNNINNHPSQEDKLEKPNYYTQNDSYIYRIETNSLSSGDKKIITGKIVVIR